MKKKISLILAITMLLTGCNTVEKADQTTTEITTTTTLETTTGASTFDETEVSINELPNRFYELDGRVSLYKIVIGDHEHDCIDTSDNALMKLGNEKLIDALKIFCVIRGFAPVDNAHTIPAGTLDPDDVYYELSPEFGTYDAIMELADDTFLLSIAITSLPVSLLYHILTEKSRAIEFVNSSET